MLQNCSKIRTNEGWLGTRMRRNVGDKCRIKKKKEIRIYRTFRTEIVELKLKRSVIHPLHQRPRGDPEEFTGSYVANDGGGPAAMLGPPRDRPPCSPGCALCPLSYPSVSYNAGTLDRPSSCCTPPAIEIGPL